jgi:hypothetical protein
MKRRCRPILLVALGLAGSLTGALDSARGQKAPGAASALPGLTLETLSATRDRPLFVPGRRPPAPPPAVQSAAAIPQKVLVPTLRGVIIQPAYTLVVLEDGATRESVVLRSGESFGPWRVTVKTDHTVQLASGSEKIELDLFDDSRDGG